MRNFLNIFCFFSYFITVNSHYELVNNHASKNKEAPSGIDLIINAAFDYQNCLRKAHSAQPLVLDATISQYSQNWANHLQQTNTFEHSKGKYGENLYMSSGGGSFMGKAPIKAWYDESKSYNYNCNCVGSAGHFTQLVWKGSKSVGFGIAQGGQSTYFVANYYPAGNYGGQYTKNVSPPDQTLLAQCDTKLKELKNLILNI